MNEKRCGAKPQKTNGDWGLCSIKKTQDGLGFGAAERNRTADLFITNELLYQLSYSGTPKLYK